MGNARYNINELSERNIKILFKIIDTSYRSLGLLILRSNDVTPTVASLINAFMDSFFPFLQNLHMAIATGATISDEHKLRCQELTEMLTEGFNLIYQKIHGELYEYCYAHKTFVLNGEQAYKAQFLMPRVKAFIAFCDNHYGEREALKRIFNSIVILVVLAEKMQFSGKEILVNLEIKKLKSRIRKAEDQKLWASDDLVMPVVNAAKELKKKVEGRKKINLDYSDLATADEYINHTTSTVVQAVDALNNCLKDPDIFYLFSQSDAIKDLHDICNLFFQWSDEVQKFMVGISDQFKKIMLIIPFQMPPAREKFLEKLQRMLNFIEHTNDNILADIGEKMIYVLELHVKNTGISAIDFNTDKFSIRSKAYLVNVNEFVTEKKVQLECLRKDNEVKLKLYAENRSHYEAELLEAESKAVEELAKQIEETTQKRLEIFKLKRLNSPTLLEEKSANEESSDEEQSNVKQAEKSQEDTLYQTGLSNIAASDPESAEQAFNQLAQYALDQHNIDYQVKALLGQSGCAYLKAVQTYSKDACEATVYFQHAYDKNKAAFVFVNENREKMPAEQYTFYINALLFEGEMCSLQLRKVDDYFSKRQERQQSRYQKMQRERLAAKQRLGSDWYKNRIIISKAALLRMDTLEELELIHDLRSKLNVVLGINASFCHELRTRKESCTAPILRNIRPESASSSTTHTHTTKNEPTPGEWIKSGLFSTRLAPKPSPPQSNNKPRTHNQ